MKSSLRVIGLMEHIYWLSWLLIYSILCVVIVAIIILIFWAGGVLSVSQVTSVSLCIDLYKDTFRYDLLI